MSHILVAHEDPGCGKSLWRLLRRNDLKASLAESCKEALDQVKSSFGSPEQVDLIITSHHKSAFNDGSLLARLNKENISIPVIVITSYTDHQKVNNILTKNSIFLNEPVEEKLLIDKLQSVLKIS